MVEVFKTSVRGKIKAREILKRLVEEFPSARINFDLEDCDRILRVEGESFSVDKVISTVELFGYSCEVWQEF
ncbi:MAG: hypothetical protein ACK40G_09265 [Cytophagaceae bacterium]